MRLNQELGSSQKSTWFMLHGLRKAAKTGVGPLADPVEVDEACKGDKRQNRSRKRRVKLAGRRAVAKTSPVGAMDLATNQATAKADSSTDKETSQGCVNEIAAEDPLVYTDEADASEGRDCTHEAV